MFKRKRSEAGFGVVEILCFAVMFSMVGLIGWYVINENQRSQETLDNIGGAEVQTSSEKSATAGEKFVFDNLGVSIVLPSVLKGLKYEPAVVDGNHNAGRVVMKDLSDKIIDCNPSSLTRDTEFAFLSSTDGKYNNDEPGVGLLKQFDSFFVGAARPNGLMCEESTNGEKDVQALMSKYNKALAEAFSSAALVEKELIQ